MATLLQQIQALRPGQVPALTARTSSPAYTSPGFRASAPAGSAAGAWRGSPLLVGGQPAYTNPAQGAAPVAPTPAPPAQESTGGGAGGAGGPGDGSPFATPDFFANDARLASAFSMASQGADQIQGYQADQSPSLARMSTPPEDHGSQLRSDVWVTVPVDKVQVANGKGTITPLYAEGRGYRDTGVGHRIPPVPAAGRQQ